MARLSATVFCDESKARGFVLAASYVPSHDVSRLRGVVTGLMLRRQVRIHFRREDDDRKERILTALIEAQCISTTVYDAARHSDKTGRDIAIGRMTDDAAQLQAVRIVVETDDSAKAMDKLIIARRLAIAGRERLTSFHHMRASEERLLAIPDTVAWCYAKGGSWRRRAESLIKEVIAL